MAPEMTEETNTKADILTVVIKSPSHEKDDFKVKISKNDTFNEVKQYLLELGVSNQPLTCFNLFLADQKVDLFTPIAEIIPDLDVDTVTLSIVPDAYTEAEARFHIVQIRDYLGFNSGSTSNNNNYTSVQAGISSFVTLESSLVSSATEIKKAIGEAEVDFKSYEEERLKKEKEEKKEDKKEEKKEDEKDEKDEKDDKKDESEQSETTPERERTPTVDDFIDLKTVQVFQNYIANHPMVDIESNVNSWVPTLTELVPSLPKDPSPAVRSLQLSQWNPPPPQLRLRGDLLYLHLVTLEGKTFHITSAISGFHVSNSTTDKFDPSPRKINGKYYNNASLLGLLTTLSPGIKTHLKSVAEANKNISVLSVAKPTNSFLASPWQVRATDLSTWNSADLGRTQDILTNTIENNDANSRSVRDWNEDFQSTRELPKVDEDGHNSIQDRVVRERVLNKLSFDFAEAAIKGAISIVNGDLIALNANERPEAQIFLHNGIFFSYGADGVGTFADQGGDDCARVAAGKDVAGVNFISQLDIDGICPLCTTIVDYCGRRIVAQAPVPGIFRETTENQIVYGSIDNGAKIVNDETFAPYMEKIADICHISTHKAYDNEGNSKDLALSSEVKGLLGTDGRKYILDLYRITPPDLPFIQQHFDKADLADDEKYPHRMAVLRLEAVDEWWKSGLRVKFAEFETNKNKDKKEEEEKKEPTEEEIKAQREEEEKIINEHTKSVRFNPDVLLDIATVPEDDVEEYKKDQQLVVQISEYVTKTIVPKLISDIAKNIISTPIVGTQVTSILHKRGINMRYLGLLYELAEKEGKPLETFKKLLSQEAVVRSIKHILNNLISSIPSPIVPFAIIHYFNCLFGFKVNQSPIGKVDETLLALYPAVDSQLFTKLTVADVRSEIVKQVRRRFQIALPENWADELHLRSAFREISLKLGLQWISKNYDFDNKNPIVNGSSSERQLFNEGDLINIVPVFKHATFKSAMAEEALESGKLSIYRNEREIGVELLAESLSLYEQIYGVIHPDVARAYSQVALIYHEIGDDNVAVEFGRKAIIIAERTIGIDSAEAIYMCLNLALFEHTNKNTIGALHIAKYAFKYWNAVTLPEHPDKITTMNNVATMLYNMKSYASSAKWYQSCIDLSTSIYGEDSAVVAQFYYHLSQPQVFLKEYKAAVNTMRKSHDIFNRVQGPDHINTKESKEWLDQLVHAAVNDAKFQKVMPRLQQAREKANAIADKKILAKAVEDTPAKDKGSLGDKSINELLNYINGPSSSKSKSKKKNKKSKSAN